LVTILEEFEKQYGRKIAAIVSDQGSNYLSARNRINRDHPHILTVNCTAHLLNLLTGDVSKIPSLVKFVTRATAIVKEIKKSKVKLGHYHEEFQRFRKEQAENENSVTAAAAVSLTIPCITRWFGIRDMLKKLKQAKPVLIRLSIKEEIDFTVSVRRTLKDDRFWGKLEDIYPLYEALVGGKSLVVLVID